MADCIYIGGGDTLYMLDKCAEKGIVVFNTPGANANGVKEFISYINEKNTVLYKEPIFIEAKTGLIELSCAIQHVDLYSENVFSYVNNIPTSEGGTHETGFKSGFTRAINEAGRKLGIIKES